MALFPSTVPVMAPADGAILAVAQVLDVCHYRVFETNCEPSCEALGSQCSPLRDTRRHLSTKLPFHDDQKARVTRFEQLSQPEDPVESFRRMEDGSQYLQKRSPLATLQEFARLWQRRRNMAQASSITISITNGPSIALSDETLEINAKIFLTQAIHLACIKLIDAAPNKDAWYICCSAALYSMENPSDSTDCLALQRALLERVLARLGGTHELYLGLAVEVAVGLREQGHCIESLSMLQVLHTTADNSCGQGSIICMRILLESAITCFSLGWNDAAACRLVGVLSSSEARGYMTEAALARLHLAFIYEASGRYSEAAGMYEEVRTWAKENNNSGFIQEAEQGIVNIDLKKS